MTSQNVFTYGSLMFAPVWQRVVTGHYESTAATLDDHVRHALRDDTYPGMLAKPGASVDGVLYLDVAPADLQALDRFEGEQYVRASVLVRTDAGPLPAQTYLFTALERLSEHAWDPQAFALQAFLNSYCRDALGD